MPKSTGSLPELKWRNEIAYAVWYEGRKQKRFSLRTRNEDTAKIRFAQFLLEGDLIFNTPEGITVGQALDLYHKEHVAPNCAAPERQQFAIRNLKAFFKETPLASVDVPMSHEYAAARRDGRIGGTRYGHRRQAADATIRRELNVLLAAAQHNKRWGRTDAVISVDLPADKTIGRDDEAGFYSQEELQTLRRAAYAQATAPGADAGDIELPLFIDICYITGARRRSIENLRRTQIRWPQKRVILQPPGKRATKKRQPIVAIGPALAELLAALCEIGGEDRLFGQRDFYTRYRALCRRCGLADRAKPHLLRHSRATHLLQEGVRLYDVARLLGDTIQTVDRVYGHHAHDSLSELM